jgi:hypothetical protein
MARCLNRVNVYEKRVGGNWEIYEVMGIILRGWIIRHLDQGGTEKCVDKKGLRNFLVNLKF